FFAHNHLKRIDPGGGPPVTLCEANIPGGGAWNDNGVIIFNNGAGRGIWRVPAAGGTAVPVTTPDTHIGEISHFYPVFLPDGNHFLYLASGSNREENAIWVADLNSKRLRRVTKISSNVIYSPSGFLLFTRNSTLLAQPFDADSVQTTGDS